MDQYLRVSALSAYLKLRETIVANPLFSMVDARRFLIARSHMGGELDWESAKILNDRLDVDVSGTRAEVFQRCILALVELEPPTWISILFSGREIAARTLEPDVLQCFQVAGAFDPIPSAETVRWLDQLARIALSRRDMQNIEVGRTAERLALEYERQQVGILGIDRPVEWVSLNENFAGYDLKSWTLVDGLVVPKLVEVKGCSSDSRIIYITRNEWEVGSSVICPYVFQIWALSSGAMTEVSVEEMRADMPRDSGKGRWQTTQVHLT